MATFVEKNGKIQVKVRKCGVSKSATFSKKTDAAAWARKLESEIERGLWCDLGEAEKLSLSDALDRYLKTKTAHKKSKVRETARIANLQKEKFASKALSKVSAADIANFRDEEKKRGMADNSIRLDLALLSNLFNVAAREWNMDGLQNPVQKIKKPKAGAGRDRRLVGDEETRIIDALAKAMPRTPAARALVVVAIETGMRQSELLGLKRSDITGRIARLHDTKAGTPRDVPLSLKAKAAIDALPARLDGYVFGIRQDRLVRAFATACKRAGIENLKFHDLRHEAASRLAPLYQAHELAKIFGWKTVQMAMHYYQSRAEDFLARMDAAAAA